jgi:hypothetical protein
MSCLWSCFSTAEKREPIQYELVQHITSGEKKCVQINGMTRCLICNMALQCSHMVVQCIFCHRYIGHVSCYTRSWTPFTLPHCRECGAAAT